MKEFTFFMSAYGKQIGGTLASSFEEAKQTFNNEGVRGVLVCKGKASSHPETQKSGAFKFSASEEKGKIEVWFKQVAGVFSYGEERRLMSPQQFADWADDCGRPTSYSRGKVS